MPKTNNHPSGGQLALFEELRREVVETRRAVLQTLDPRRAADAARALEKYPVNMRIDQVAAYLNCTKPHVVNLIENGLLNAEDIAATGKRKQYRIKRAEVAAFDLRQKADPNK